MNKNIFYCLPFQNSPKLSSLAYPSKTPHLFNIPKSSSSSMASLSIGHSFHSKNSSTSAQDHLKNNRKRPRFLISLSCQSQEPISSSNLKTQKEKKENKQGLLSQFLVGVEKVGKGLKDNLSPKQKGDWKDLVLMSLSFAVYVYISQKIVCAYCAWTSMIKQPW